jgi:hypothetical protein
VEIMTIEDVTRITRRSAKVYVESIDMELTIQERVAQDQLDAAAFLKRKQMENITDQAEMAGPAVVFQFQLIEDSIKCNLKPFAWWKPWTWRNRSWNRRLHWRYLRRHLTFSEVQQIHQVIERVEGDDQDNYNGKKKAPPVPESAGQRPRP